MTEKLNARQWVLIGLLIRLAVMPFTLHGDMFFIHEAPHLLVHGEGNAYGVATAKNNLGYYPPFTLIFFAFMQFVFRFVSPDYEEFLHKIGSLEFAPLESEHLFLSLFMLKMPYLIFDFLILHFCWKMISTGQKRRIFAVFWSLNPLVIYGSYMAGQLDILPSFFVVLACYLCLQKGKGNWAALAIASGCLFKIFPIVFLPLVILIAGRNLKDYVRMAICGALPVILVYYMFYLISGDSVIKLLSRHSYNMRSAVDYKDLVIRFFQAGAYMLVCAHVLSFRQKRLDYEKLARCFLVVYLAVYWNLIIHWTHYLIWFTPFMILFVVESPERKRICYFLLAVIFMGGFRSRESGFGIFAPINPDFFLSLPSLTDVTGFLFNQRAYDTVVDWLYKGTTALIGIFILKNLYTSKRTHAVEQSNT